MKNTAHTPGPWAVKTITTRGAKRPVTIVSIHEVAGFKTICYKRQDGPARDEDTANLTLCASAPGLLEACRLALETFAGVELLCSSPEAKRNAITATSNLRAAIAKATGKE